MYGSGFSVVYCECGVSLVFPAKKLLVLTHYNHCATIENLVHWILLMLASNVFNGQFRSSLTAFWANVTMLHREIL